MPYNSSPPPNTHTRKKDEKKHSKMQRCGSKVKNFPCEKYRNQKHRRTPVKLESKKQAKK